MRVTLTSLFRKLGIPTVVTERTSHDGVKGAGGGGGLLKDTFLEHSQKNLNLDILLGC